MSEATSTAETTEIQKSTYLDRFTQAGFIEDKKNIEAITQYFLNTLQNQSRRGTLHAVGGTVTKPLPRKDTDLIITLEPQKEDPVKTEKEDQISFEERQFELFKQIINEMFKNSIFKVEKETEPHPDYDYGHMGVITSGRFKIKGGLGTQPIEIIVNPFGKKPVSIPQHPIVLLAQTT